MNLQDLLTALGDYEIKGTKNISVHEICYHSNEVKPGALFVAIPGFNHDGRKFVPEAVAKGASAVVFEGKFFDNLRATQIRVLGARLALARLSACYFVHPTKFFYLAGITGTNGKTTLTYLMEALWQGADRNSGVVGTVNARYRDTVYHLGQTTPESRDLQRLFSEMRDRGIKEVCMEVSSHALSLERIEGCHFDACVFTNLSQDHLDFHKTMDAYYLTKERLFTEYLSKSPKKNKLALICSEYPHGSKLLEKLKRKKFEVKSYGFGNKNDLYPKEFKLGRSGISAELKCNNETVEIDSPLLGRFNLLSIMAAVQLGIHSGLTLREIQKGIGLCRSIPGRLEKIEDSKGRLIFVDYAHTPDALKNVLETVKEIATGKILVVFGCGGDRDAAKRPLMGFEAAKLSDICIVTSDNPRTEEPENIIEGIIPGIKKAGASYLVEKDRRLAIQMALERSKKGDVVLIAGKGHEDYQIIGKKKYPFSDQEIVRGFLGKKK